MFLVGEDTNLLCPFDERPVELRPRTACERYDTHIMIWHHQSMGQHLQGVEGGVEDDFCLWHLAFDSIGKAEEQRITRSKDDNLRGERLVLREDGIKWSHNINPLGISRQELGDYFMMTLSTSKHLSMLDDFRHFRWKPRTWIIRYSDDNEMQHLDS